MVFSISPTASLLLHSSSTLSTGRKILSFSYPRNSSISIPKTAIFRRGVPQLGLSPFAPWNGLKLVFRCQVNRVFSAGRKGNQKGRRGVYASLFGIGAPEVLVIGVVALLVFGPKGLAEVARNLGKTVRAFQPTIRELQEVSREFKSTLQREIGIDDVNSPISSSTSMYNGTNAVASDSETTSKTDSSSSENYDAAAVNVKTDQVLQSHSQLQKQQEDEAGSLQIQSSSDADENSKSESPSKEAAAAVTTTPPTNP